MFYLWIVEKLLDEATFLGLSYRLREGNKCVDLLANREHDDEWVTTILERPPENLEKLLLLDATGVVPHRI